jgi:hypothetical protein
VFTRLFPIFALALLASACAPTPAAPPYSDDTAVVAIGDSIMVAATGHLTESIDGIVIDAEEGRPFSDGEPALANEIAANGTPDVLVVALGTNAGAGASQIDELMAAADGIDRVIFVNVRVPRDWESSTNQAISDAADRFDTIEVVDWYAASNGNDGLFRSDGYHPSKVGSELWANLIAVQVKNP